MDLSPEYEARRQEACDAIEAILERFSDVFGPNASTDDELSEEAASGSWAITGWCAAIGWIRIDGEAPSDEFVRAISPRRVSYPTRVGLLTCAIEAAL